ncbi:hypothetical protein Tco_0238360 [Tanacetum coccineum]
MGGWVVLEGWACAFHQDKASSVKVPVANVTLSSSAHLLRENTDSVRSNQRMRSTAPSLAIAALVLSSCEDAIINQVSDGIKVMNWRFQI